MAFILHPRPLPGESAAGFLMRLFEINGVPWSRERFRTRGIVLSELLSGTSQDALRSFGLDPNAFEATTARVRSKKSVTLAGEELHRDDWSNSARRWCPCCFSDDVDNESLGGRTPGWRVHRRFWWDVAPVLTCPLHRVRLERACPKCGDPVGWETGSLTTCRFGHPLLFCEPVEVAPDHMLADAYIVGRLGGAARVRVAFLDALTLREALDAMEHFGTAASGGAFGALAKFDADRHAEVFSAGYRVAAGWPESFDRLLDEIADRPDVGLGAWGLDQVYGYLVMWARSVQKTRLGKTVLDAVLAHHAARSTVRPGSAAAAHVGEDAPLNVKQIADSLGMHSQTAKAYLVALGLWTKKTKRGTPVLFPPSTVGMLMAAISDHAAMEDLPALLGIALNQAKALVAAGFVEQLPLDATRHLTHRRFSRAKVADLVTRLVGGAPAMDRTPDGMMDVMTACRYAAAGGIPGVVKMILDGQVKVHGRLRGVEGLRSVVVDPKEIGVAKRVNAGAEMDLAEAGKALGLGADTVGTCVKAGLLDHVLLGQKIAIPRVSVETFRQTYVTARELTGPLGTRERYLIDTLASIGIERAQTRGPKRPNVAIFLRSDIPPNLADLHNARFRRARPSA